MPPPLWPLFMLRVSRLKLRSVTCSVSVSVVTQSFLLRDRLYANLHTIYITCFNYFVLTHNSKPYTSVGPAGS